MFNIEGSLEAERTRKNLIEMYELQKEWGIFLLSCFEVKLLKNIDLDEVLGEESVGA